MQVAHVLSYIHLSKVTTVVFAQRTKSGQLVALFATGEEPENMTKGHTFGQFHPTEDEQKAIDSVLSVMPAPVSVKADPMVNRLKKSEIEKPVAFVLRFVQANPNMVRKDLIATLVNEYGVATYTARTQVQVGLQRRKALAELRAIAEREQADRLAKQAEEQAESQDEDEETPEVEGEQSNYE